jgi:hypothetical protein
MPSSWARFDSEARTGDFASIGARSLSGWAVPTPLTGALPGGHHGGRDVPIEEPRSGGGRAR